MTVPDIKLPDIKKALFMFVRLSLILRKSILSWVKLLFIVFFLIIIMRNKLITKNKKEQKIFVCFVYKSFFILINDFLYNKIFIFMFSVIICLFLTAKKLIIKEDTFFHPFFYFAYQGNRFSLEILLIYHCYKII